jgi:DNA-binding transcriptional ArsR family regulator
MTGDKCMAVMKALGEINRLRIMRLLLKEQLGVNIIAHRLNLSEYNVSKHLRILKEAGLLEMEKSGKQRFYGVDSGLKDVLVKRGNVLELGCCTFRFDRLPK